MGAPSKFIDIKRFGVVPIHAIPDTPQTNQLGAAVAGGQPRQLGPNRLFSSP